ncbi:MAG: bifunctional 4-hydroxy-2-oxoglutarate aldolase/2-dehydro-3-deoxy-phosphogluconate aldolase [Oscillospiraceae bacterium]|jgi:2-dehydro-3-deoxyphosphogluconate aldolase/(4S)-4-hydroxy-2-oxoglutarate aldolase|nr:bifunctional 4-hydroxy-2-oxoglutarate aldolase/2-dehydro-3-deoxy-phosphogluconate aldolase [Oscillospiraceae bacterium]
MRRIIEAFSRCRIVPVVAIERAADAPALARALLAGGVGVAEITFRTAAAAEAIARIAKEVPDMLVGAGTVRSTEQVRQAVAAGAQFVVAPAFSPAVCAFCAQGEVPVFPGCATPTEMEAAIALGLTHLKFFPAEQAGGAAYLKAMASVFPEVKFMPTGGISAKNLREYLDLPNVLACGGSWMCSPQRIAAQDWATITKLCKESICNAR